MGLKFRNPKEIEFKRKLALGTVQFGLNYGIANEVGQISVKQASEILAVAKNEDIDLLDTAIAYGESETVLGKVGVTNFKIVSKLSPLPPKLSNVNLGGRPSP